MEVSAEDVMKSRLFMVVCSPEGMKAVLDCAQDAAVPRRRQCAVGTPARHYSGRAPGAQGRRLGRTQESRAAYGKAIELAANTAEIAYLTRRRDQLG